MSRTRSLECTGLMASVVAAVIVVVAAVVGVVDTDDVAAADVYVSSIVGHQVAEAAVAVLSSSDV
jgi:hypothetical protein